MTKRGSVLMQARAALASLGAAIASVNIAAAQTAQLTPAAMPRVGTVDERYQSYNVEMLEVTGGRFWRPYGPELEAALRQPAPTPAASSGHTPSGMNPAPVRIPAAHRPHQRPAAQARRRARSGLCARQRHLGQHHVLSRDRTGSREPASGLRGRADPQQWRGVVDFSRAVNAESSPRSRRA